MATGQERPPRERCRRDIVDAIRYLVKEGIQWRAMPADLPHWRTVYDYADGWRKTGATEHMHAELREQCRIAADRTPEPTAAIIDSQSVKAAETVGKDSRGYDAGKKINGRKRHIARHHRAAAHRVDHRRQRPGSRRRETAAVEPAEGLPLSPAGLANGRYAGRLVTWARTQLKPRLKLEIVRRPDDLHTFQVLPRRWVIERTLTWITRCRRTFRDYERLPEHHETIVYWAVILTMSRRLTRGSSSGPQAI